MIEFITTLYNESAEINSLIAHVYPYVDRLNIINDGSTDDTADKIFQARVATKDSKINFKTIEHTGLCEIGRIHALEMCENDSWVIMLDADERFSDGTLMRIVDFCDNPTEGVTHLYFTQKEYIEGVQRAEFAKVKVFKKSAAHLPEVIHRDPQFDGEPENIGGYVIHRKTKYKQVMREMQYLDTYDKLLTEGKVTEGDVNWFKSMHHYVRDRHG